MLSVSEWIKLIAWILIASLCLSCLRQMTRGQVMNYYERVKEMLKNYNIWATSIENMEKQIKEIQLEEGLTAINFDNEKSAPTYKITHPTEQTAIKNVSALDLIKKRLAITQSKLDRIDNCLEELDEITRKIIIMFYIEGRGRGNWIRVAREVGYSRRQAIRKADEGIWEIAKGLYGIDETENDTFMTFLNQKNSL